MTGVDFILWLQGFSSSLLDSFFVTITMMGNPEYYMIIIPILYWCINKQQAIRFTMYFLISAYVNSVVKATMARPRPSADDVRILYGKSTGGSASFPSGHAQGTASLWLYAAYYFKNKIITIIAVVVIALVSVSRLYLGLHFPIDITVGIILAAVILIIYNILYEPIRTVFSAMPFWLRILLTLILVPIMLKLPSHDKGLVVGGSLGLIIGFQLEERYIQFEESTSFTKQIIKFAIGILVLFGLKTGLKILLLNTNIINITEIMADVIRYTIIGLWITYIAPWLFIKLKLSRRKSKWG